MQRLRIFYAISLLIVFWFIVWCVILFKQHSADYESSSLSPDMPLPRLPRQLRRRPPASSPIPPAHAAIFRNDRAAYPPSDPFYPDQPISPDHPRLRHLLAHWVHLSTALRFRYVLVADSLLGAIRNGRLLPSDTRAQVAVHRRTAKEIIALALGNVTTGWPGGTRVDGVAIHWNSAVIDHQPWADGEVRLIVNMHRAQGQPGDSVRYDRRGVDVRTQVDSVAFSGPFARLISVANDETHHIDIYCTTEFDEEGRGRRGGGGGRGEDDGRVEVDREVGPEQASFPREVEACLLEGYPVWCPPERDYAPVLRRTHGKHYLRPQRP